MPWEGGQIHVAPVAVESSGEHVKLRLGEVTHVAGTPGAIAAMYPLWADAGHDVLYFLSDEGGPRFANPWTWARGHGAQPALAHPVAEEYGAPPWKIGEAYEAVLDGGLRVTVAIKGGRSVLYALDGVSSAQELPSPFVAVHSLRRAGPRQVVFVGATTDAAPAVILASFSDSVAPTFEALTQPAESALTGDILAKPEALTLTGAGGAPLHVIFYPPTNAAYEGSSLSNELPPCIFSAHGGPTGRLADTSLPTIVQFFTSRGFAWVWLPFGRVMFAQTKSLIVVRCELRRF
jgi:dipeptidyl aminopeptidase/acylaminoacyl peptidase